MSFRLGFSFSLSSFLAQSGIRFGGELVSNGTFTTDTTGWTPVAATLSVVASRLRITATAANPFVYQAITCVVGRRYRLECEVFADNMAGNTFIAVGTSAGGQQSLFINTMNTLGVFSGTFVATQTTHYVSVAGSSSTVAAETLDCDNISVREIQN